MAIVISKKGNLGFPFLVRQGFLELGLGLGLGLGFPLRRVGLNLLLTPLTFLYKLPFHCESIATIRGHYILSITM
jgi:hypothetical protein